MKGYPFFNSPTTATLYFFKLVKSENTNVPTITYNHRHFNRKMKNLI